MSERVRIEAAHLRTLKAAALAAATLFEVMPVILGSREARINGVAVPLPQPGATAAEIRAAYLAATRALAAAHDGEGRHGKRRH